jgi:cell wall assembly regulator SMI1
MTDIVAAWNKFKDQIIVYPPFKEVLNPGSNKEYLNKIEKQMEVTFPDDFKTLYLTNNGQKSNEDGIFKASSGYSKFNKLCFLEIDKVLIIWNMLNVKEIDVFTPEMIPFAVDGEEDAIDDVYCINSKTEEVYLLWVSTIDWTMPDDWQTARLKRADGLIEFIEYQIKMY